MIYCQLSNKHVAICNFADDNTIYSCSSTLQELISNLEHDLLLVLDWFSINQLVANPEKFPVMFLGTKLNKTSINVNNSTMKSSDSVKLLGIDIDNKLSFRQHITNLCGRANKYTSCLYRIRKILNIDQVKLLYQAYIKSVFNYCPLIWMFCDKTSYRKIERVQKRSLTALYKTNKGFIDDLLQIHNGISFHKMNIFSQLIEIYKTVNGLNPSFSREIFFNKPVVS